MRPLFSLFSSLSDVIRRLSSRFAALADLRDDATHSFEVLCGKPAACPEGPDTKDPLQPQLRPSLFVGALLWTTHG